MYFVTPVITILSALRDVSGALQIYPATPPANNSTIVLPIENILDTFYYVTISLGTPTRDYKVILDTASADFWISDEKHGSSATDDDLNIRAETFYGLGSASGGLHMDLVTTGPFTTRQTFMRASTFSNRMPSQVDGLLGLAFSPLSWVNHALPKSLKGNSSLIENLARQHPNLACFGISLGWKPDAVSPGELIIGDSKGNPARYVGSPAAISWYSVDGSKRDWWHVPVKGLSIDDTVVSRRDVRAIVDTGAALIVVDYETAEKANAVFGAYPTNIWGIWGVSCDVIAKSNITATVTIGKRDFLIEARTLRVQHQADNPDVCYAPFMASKWAEKNGVWILGAVFLRSYYTLYDYNYTMGTAHPRVGFVEAK